MSETDKRGRLLEQPFAYRVSKDGKVFICWQDRQVMILKGKECERFLARMESAGDDILKQQLVMAKVTGNFKHGNEK